VGRSKLVGNLKRRRELERDSLAFTIQKWTRCVGRRNKHEVCETDEEKIDVLNRKRKTKKKLNYAALVC
jgi:hypothetical protein